MEDNTVRYPDPYVPGKPYLNAEQVRLEKASKEFFETHSYAGKVKDWRDDPSASEGDTSDE